MIELRAYASEIAKEAGGVLEGKDCYIEYLSLDTREDIKKPFCFVAICGKNFDGHSFIECALEKGAELIISEKKVNTDKAVIYVESTVKALGMIAKSRKKGIKVVGVTGSTGKTTTKDMILSVLGSKFNACGTRENQNNELGVALTLLQAEENSICVIEMGARKKGDISYLAQICDPFVSVVTNCGSAHIEYFKTKKAIFDEKIKIITKNTKYAIIPCEKRFKKKIPKDATPIFIGEQKNYRFKNIKLGENGLVGDLCLNDKVVTNIESNIFSKKV